MSLSTLTGIPDSFEAGSTVLFTENFADYSVSSWTAKIYFVLGTAAPITVTATTSGTNFLFTLSEAITSSFTPGKYDYVIYVSSSTERTTAKQGTVTVLQDMSKAREATAAEIALAGIEAAINKLSSKVNSSVSFNGQTFTHNDLNSLTRARTYYKAEVIREERQRQLLRGATDQSRYGVEFVNTVNTNPWQQ